MRVQLTGARYEMPTTLPLRTAQSPNPIDFVVVSEAIIDVTAHLMFSASELSGHGAFGLQQLEDDLARALELVMLERQTGRPLRGLPRPPSPSRERSTEARFERIAAALPSFSTAPAFIAPENSSTSEPS